MTTLEDIAKHEYQMLVNIDENIVDVSRRDPELRGCFVGPLATVPMGCTAEDDDGDEVVCLDSEDGCILYAIAVLPKFSELVIWARSELGKLNGIHFDGTTESGRFHLELRKKLDWIISAVNDRQQSITSGEWGVM